MATKKKNKIKTKPKAKSGSINKERKDTLEALWAVAEELNERLVSNKVDQIPTGALKCILGAMYCGLNLMLNYLDEK
jgi:hypothetical protein